MPTITINGPIGSGTFEVGQLVSQRLGLNYVDRLVLAEAARRVGSPVAALVEREQRVVRFRERLTRFLQTMLERSALSGAGSEPYFGHGLEMLPAETYTELAGDPASTDQRLNDQAFIEAMTSVMQDLARTGDVVIIGRGSNLILRENPRVFHVGLLSSPELRVENIMAREHFSREEAVRYVAELEEARVTFFRKFFKVQPTDPELYHVVVNTGKLDATVASEVIAQAVTEMGF